MKRPAPILPTPLAALVVAMTLGGVTGCASQRLSDDVPDITRGFRPHVQQVLDNIAAFTKDPGAWPSHVLVYKGAFETRSQWTGAIGTSTKVENSVYGTTHWDLASLDDPYDIRRVRLLYQWQVGHIPFDELARRWSEIRDRPVLDGNGKPVMGADGRPSFNALSLPVTRDTRRDWVTNRMPESFHGMAGQSERHPLPGASAVAGAASVWVIDSEGAANFSVAILTAMANSRVKARWGDAVMMSP